MPFDIPLHPVVVHFPVALLVTGFFVDLAGRILRKDWLGHAALLLLVLGALGTVAATQTGDAAEDEILQTPALHEELEEHEEGGKRTMWLFLALAGARAGLTWWRKFTPLAGWIALLVWAGGLVLLFETAHHGGRLVYRHGAGVQAVAAPGSPEVSPPAPGRP